ncbi:hypothetical protein MHAS_03337 [Mycolicibacterium hassiacum DSM 44199]|uniref:DUF5642 family protein n=1 Tax=Mycolicibacterium hassiacum TaxID=46351 RepID=UPI000A9F2DBB|nr:DUF5642 family protein [Mycolicibacterium hassiacum]VCT91620.1 hypothetical protein MHAS_03337 [Mycolicibacterium hassiacum DSM 44199]
MAVSVLCLVSAISPRSCRTLRRWSGAVAAAVLGLAGCGTSGAPGAAEPTPPAIDPARIERVRAELPPEYETAALSGAISPVDQWGLGAHRAADPPQCAALGAPAADAASARGWSASGTGGIVYAVVAAAPDPPAAALTADCAHWSVAAGSSSARVESVPPPAIDDAETIAMAVEVATVVEGGTETHAHADTVTAYLDGHVVVVTVVTDPGAAHPQLSNGFAADLTARTVAALRG